jgi:hypothetical protein
MHQKHPPANVATFSMEVPPDDFFDCCDAEFDPFHTVIIAKTAIAKIALIFIQFT